MIDGVGAQFYRLLPGMNLCENTWVYLIVVELVVVVVVVVAVAAAVLVPVVAEQ
jgi:hypothetical protein